MDYCYFSSPLGKLLLVQQHNQLTNIYFPSFQPNTQIKQWAYNIKPFKNVIKQLAQYFMDNLINFNLPLTLVGTEFQQQVWRALNKIPYGNTKTYGDIAKLIGQPTAARAVGKAIGNNPIPIIIPCHRVIACNGKLGGFSSTLDNKLALLKLEGVFISY